jgi:serine/threonine-protein kinase PknG
MTVTDTACGRPGCAGTIVDGYCDTCGLAPAKGGVSASTVRLGQSAVVTPSGRVSGRVDVSRLTTRSRQSGSTGSSARRSRIGAGVVDISPAATVDPNSVVMADPSVPEGRRFCTRCDSPVGRGKNGQPGRTSGFCSQCGGRFDFAAKLVAGELVAGQYEVAGALAHGGLGWIYLVRDRNVSGRWCVLKGLLDTADPAAAEAAVAERRFLAEVSHPAIVEIFNFVNHNGQGYIVMEYVGGPSIKQLAKRRRDAGQGPMPVPDAAAYMLTVLPALGYLHDQGLVYCDFKPDNVIHAGDAVKLIDMGGVRRLDDADAAIFGTVGYQAPEVPRTGPTVASDLYTVGRSLAVLILDWPGWQGPRHPGRARRPLALPGAGVRARPERTLRRRRRDGGVAARCAVPGGRSQRRPRPAPHQHSLQPAAAPARRLGLAHTAEPPAAQPPPARQPGGGRGRHRPRRRRPPGGPGRRAELGRPRGGGPGPLRAG